MIYQIALIVHILAVVSWMAALFYLPRIMVYHAEQSTPSDKLDQVFQVMEAKLARLIMLPSMIATLFSGVALIGTGVVDWTLTWPYIKFLSVFLMFGFHGWLSKKRKDFIRGNNTMTGTQLRIANEIPTILLIIIVCSVIIKF